MTLYVHSLYYMNISIIIIVILCFLFLFKFGKDNESSTVYWPIDQSNIVDQCQLIVHAASTHYGEQLRSGASTKESNRPTWFFIFETINFVDNIYQVNENL